MNIHSVAAVCAVFAGLALLGDKPGWPVLLVAVVALEAVAVLRGIA